MSDPALSITGLEAGLGDLQILKGVDLEVPFGDGPQRFRQVHLVSCADGQA